MKRVYFKTYGCQMNRLDTELMLGALATDDYVQVDAMDEADLVLFNTCSVRALAEDKVYSALGSLRHLKESRPEVVVGVVGCMAQNDAEGLRTKMPHVDLIVGPSQIDHLPRFVDEVRGASLEARDSRSPARVEREHKEVRFARNPATRPVPFQAFVEIIRGCDVHCTFCVVPTTRGPERSRPPEEVLAEVRALAEDGVREVTLLGQTVDHYGKDHRSGYTLADLLTDVAAIDGLWRVRFITSHPRYLDDRILGVVGDEEKVCGYLHMPLQSGSDRILAAMRRKYDLARYRDRIEKARELVENVSIASDFIVGFPGETEEDFEATVRAMEEFRFTNSFIFKYSPRPGTPAADLVDDVETAEKKRRNQVLLDLQNRHREEHLRGMLGRTVEILVEGESKRDATKYTGRTRENHIVAIDADPSLVGQRVEVRLNDCTALTLFGEVVQPATA